MKRTEGGKVLQFTDSYSYTKDQEGKVISATIKSESPAGYYNGTTTISFTYQCQ